MNKISITNAVGYAKIAVILAFAGVVFTKYMPLMDATAAFTVVLGALSAVGNFYAQDINASEVIQQTSITPAHDGESAKVVTEVQAPKANK
jgi:hypothetical protein